MHCHILIWSKHGVCIKKISSLCIHVLLVLSYSMHVFLVQLYFFFFQPQSTFYRPSVYVPFSHSTGMFIFVQSYDRMSVSSILSPYYQLANFSINVNSISLFPTLAQVCPFHRSYCYVIFSQPSHRCVHFIHLNATLSSSNLNIAQVCPFYRSFFFQSKQRCIHFIDPLAMLPSSNNRIGVSISSILVLHYLYPI